MFKQPGGNGSDSDDCHEDDANPTYTEFDLGTVVPKQESEQTMVDKKAQY